MKKHIALTLLFLFIVIIGGCGDDVPVENREYYNPYNTSQTEDEWYNPYEEHQNQEQYEATGTNPFVLTAHDPLSTFAADVDTASYDIFRRDIARGILPNKDSVRLEEYVNYFDYNYPTPEHQSDTPFSIDIVAADSPFAETTLIRLGIKGKANPPQEKKPTNLVFLVDISGSMSSPDKIGLVKLILRETLSVLEPTDTISIVTYAGHTKIALEPTPVSNSETITGIINGFDAGGSTDGASGILLAYEQAEAGFVEGGVNHILLCSDGDFNIGISSTDALLELIEEKRQTGITFTILGFGSGNLNDAMMEAISNAGNGIYSVITDEDQAYDYAHNKMLATINHICKDMKIQVEFNTDHIFAYRLLGYENRAIRDEDFRNDRVDAGEIGAEHTVTALYEVVMTGNSIPVAEGAPALVEGDPAEYPVELSDDEMCRVRIRYKEVGASEEDSAFEVVQGLSITGTDNNFEETNSDFQWAAAMAAFSEILKESPFAKRESINVIREIITRNQGSDADRIEFLRLFEEATDLL